MHTTTTALLTALIVTPILARPYLPIIRRQEECGLTELASLSLPASTLPAPQGLTLTSIVIGRGVQNYTCAAGNTTAAPAGNGAIAVLYDASCIAVSDPETFATLATTALTLDLPADPQDSLDCNGTPLDRSGHHFFNAAKTPVFDFTESGDVADLNAIGVGLMKVNNKVNAPTGTADVPWLQLGTDGTGHIKMIYRVQTRAGVAPAACDAGQTELSVQYAAEYWIFTDLKNEEPTEPETPEDGEGEDGEDGEDGDDGEDGEDEEELPAPPAGSTTPIPTPTSVPSTPLTPAQPNKPPTLPAPGAGPTLPPRGPSALPGRPTAGPGRPIGGPGGPRPIRPRVAKVF